MLAAHNQFFASQAVAGGGSDSDYASVSLLAKFDSGFTVDNGPVGLTIVAGGNATTTASSKYGANAGIFDGSGDFLSITGSPAAMSFGTGDFTIEFWWLYTTGTTPTMFDWRPPGTNTVYPVIYTTGGTMRYFANSGDRITGTGAVNDGAWHHIALCRSGTSTKLFLDGTQDGATYTDSTNYLVASTLYFGANTDGTFSLNGKIDEIRVTKGVARYTSNFTAPTAGFPTS